MPYEFCMWLNGNALVLLPRAWAATEVDAQLDVQLAAYVKAEHEFSMFHEYWDWCAEYRESQGDFGCSFVEIRPAERPKAVSQPFKCLRETVLAALPVQYRDGAMRCLDAFCLPPEHAALKALWVECVRPAQSGKPSTLVTELRVVMPGVIIVSAQLRFESQVSVEVDWSRQRFDSASLGDISIQCTQYLINDVVLNSIRDELHQRYAPLRAAYSLKMPTV
ncbi:hypothetical protein [Pseudomonas sp. PAGU 2196]|uniref:hypothetical protein n=1 Tax=Pseudomonas sp. PAGU 2196 TaxID=2793997 RepID=UPI001EDCAED4|nr:hypothetical protein [Pseudomonas sp. PAGU 2196]